MAVGEEMEWSCCQCALVIISPKKLIHGLDDILPTVSYVKRVCVCVWEGDHPRQKEAYTSWFVRTLFETKTCPPSSCWLLCIWITITPSAETRLACDKMVHLSFLLFKKKEKESGIIVLQQTVALSPLPKSVVCFSTFAFSGYSTALRLAKQQENSNKEKPETQA